MESPHDRQMTVHHDDGAGNMFLSAVVFGLFGLMTMQWGITSTAPGPGFGKAILFIEIFRWSIPASAVVYLVAGLVTRLVALRLGHWIYTIGGVLSAGAIGVAAVMDFADGDHFIPIFTGPPACTVIAAAFALWNGYGSVQGLRLLMASRPQHPAAPYG